MGVWETCRVEEDLCLAIEGKPLAPQHGHAFLHRTELPIEKLRSWLISGCKVQPAQLYLERGYIASDFIKGRIACVHRGDLGARGCRKIKRVGIALSQCQGQLHVTLRGFVQRQWIIAGG
jgi:hypothetical protein